MEILLRNILKELDNKKVSATQFQKDLGLYASAVSEWKSGASKSYEKHLAKIADYFCVSVDYLLGNTLYRTLDEAADVYAITAESAVADVTEWLEDHEYEVSRNDNDNGSGAEWVIAKDGHHRFFEENRFQDECLGLAALIKSPEDIIYSDWVKNLFSSSNDSSRDRELLELFHSLDLIGQSAVVTAAAAQRKRMEKNEDQDGFRQSSGKNTKESAC